MNLLPVIFLSVVPLEVENLSQILALVESQLSVKPELVACWDMLLHCGLVLQLQSLLHLPVKSVFFCMFYMCDFFIHMFCISKTLEHL